MNSPCRVLHSLCLIKFYFTSRKFSVDGSLACSSTCSCKSFSFTFKCSVLTRDSILYTISVASSVVTSSISCTRCTAFSIFQHSDFNFFQTALNFYLALCTIIIAMTWILWGKLNIFMKGPCILMHWIIVKEPLENLDLFIKGDQSSFCAGLCIFSLIRIQTSYPQRHWISDKGKPRILNRSPHSYPKKRGNWFYQGYLHFYPNQTDYSYSQLSILHDPF